MTTPPVSQKAETYFQFPLSALAYGGTAKERLNAILCYCVVATGRIFWNCSSPQQRSVWLGKMSYVQKMPKGFDWNNEGHLALLVGAIVLRVTMYSVSSTLATHKALDDFRQQFERHYGKDAIVRLRSTFLFEARDGGGVTLMEFNVLAAIYSVIGKKAYPVRITHKTILHRALGYRKAAIAAAELPGRTDGAKPLTEWRLRKILESLTTRKFFCRRTFARRQTYYTHRMSASDFELALFNMKTCRTVARQMQRDKDQAITERIRKARRKNGL